jgi:hypothetical protein
MKNIQKRASQIRGVQKTIEMARAEGYEEAEQRFRAEINDAKAEIARLRDELQWYKEGLRSPPQQEEIGARRNLAQCS